MDQFSNIVQLRLVIVCRCGVNIPKSKNVIVNVQQIMHIAVHKRGAVNMSIICHKLLQQRCCILPFVLIVRREEESDRNKQQYEMLVRYIAKSVLQYHETCIMEKHPVNQPSKAWHNATLEAFVGSLNAGLDENTLLLSGQLKLYHWMAVNPFVYLSYQHSFICLVHACILTQNPFTQVIISGCGVGRMIWYGYFSSQNNSLVLSWSSVLYGNWWQALYE